MCPTQKVTERYKPNIQVLVFPPDTHFLSFACPRGWPRDTLLGRATFREICQRLSEEAFPSCFKKLIDKLSLFLTDCFLPGKTELICETSLVQPYWIQQEEKSDTVEE